VNDFAWWSGLTKADVKLGLELARPHVVQEFIDGKSCWHASSPPVAPERLGRHAQRAPGQALLPPFDEYTIAYRDHGVVLEAAPFRPFSAAEHDAFVAAAQRFGAFLGMPVALTVAPPAR